jgi:ASC-1-like (ASCH) protein
MKVLSKTNYTTFKNHRAEPYFTSVKRGKKTIESRIRKDNYKRIKPGDHIVIYNVNETDNFEVKVKRVAPYTTFQELLHNEPLDKVLPGIKTINEGLKNYQQFYTKDQETKFGVVAIEVERLKTG